jgi:hypothetical protein
MLNGGAGNDFLVGLGGNDFLIGGPGNDNMQGGAGNDLYYVEDAGDQIFENGGEGDDLAVCFTSFALGAGQSVETLSALEGTTAINLTGNALAQSLYGNAGDNILSGNGGADYLSGGAGNDTFVLTSPAGGVATIADYAALEVVDITQLLSVAGGTDLVGGGYVRVTAAGQLQVDTNGGSDAFVTLANVSGSSPVTIRYLAGGAATDLTVSRSASMSMAMAAAAAGIAVKLPADTSGMDAASASGAGIPDPSTMQHSQTLAPLALDEAGMVHSSLLAPLASPLPAGHLTETVAFHAPAAPATSGLFDAYPAALAAPAALLTATDAPAHAAIAGATALAAPSVAMPAAAQMAALTASDGAQHSQIVEQVLADALGVGGKGPDLDALLTGVASHAGAPMAGLEQLAALASGHAFAAAAAPFGDAIALDVMTMHHDAPPVA